MKKRCSVCGLSSLETQFYEIKTLSRCKPCNSLYSAKWRKANPERAILLDRKHKEKNRDKINKRKRDRRAAGLDKTDVVKSRKSSLAYVRKWKDVAYEKYGGYKCVCCGETERTFLCLDHINNDGYEHRKKMSGGTIYIWLKKHNYPQGLLQVLCHNCNHAKRFGECPHKKIQK